MGMFVTMARWIDMLTLADYTTAHDLQDLFRVYNHLQDEQATRIPVGMYVYCCDGGVE